MEERESNFIVRVINKFETDAPDELNLTVGDIVQIIKRVDKYWFRGYSDGREGNFPSAFCVEVPLEETIESHWKVFAASAPFTGQEEGDIGFDKGEILIGYTEIDLHWWRGRRLGDTIEGIFPLTHVWELKKSYLPKSNQGSTSPNSIQYAIVNYDLKPEIPEEVPLRAGDRVKIFGSHDKMYYKGECNGVTGIFPKRFVTIQENNVPTILEPSSHTYENDPGTLAFVPTVSRSSTPLVNETADLPPTYEESTRSEDSHRKNLSFDGIQSYAKVIYPFTAQREDELTLVKDEIVHLIQYVDPEEKWIQGEIDGRVGMFPTDFVKIIVDCTERKKAHSLVVTDYPPDTYARVLYDFNAEFEGEISVKEGHIVTLLRSFNSDWVEAIDDSGNEGIIPLNHAEVIGESRLQAGSSSGLSLNANLMEFSPDEPDAGPRNDMISGSLSLSTPIPRVSPALETVKEESENRSSLHGSTLAPTRPSPPVPRHPSSSRPVSSSTSPSPSPRSSSLSGSQFSLPHVPPRTSSSSTPPVPSTAHEPGENQSAPLNGQVTGDEDRSEARRKKMMEQRSCIIMEMLQSERDYCQDLRVCAKIFLHDEKMTNQLTERGVILESIFCNLEEIIVISEKLTRALEESTLCRKPENQMIGRCFLNLEEEMKQAYLVYCRDHEDVPICWKKYEENPETKLILQKGFDRLKSETNCFDVPSLLIKPVQRILKYPLLLNELLKCTDESHPDRDDIIKAANMITDMAQDINELKRRKDLVFKYRKGNNSSFSAKISKLNLHTMKKKSSRFGYRISTTFGLSALTKDEKFEEESNKFKVLEKTIKIFLKDLNLFIDSMQEFVNTCFQLSESIASFYAEKCNQPDVEEFRTCQRLLKTDHWEEMKKSLETRVIAILKQLISKFHNPIKLIEKRHDKLLDYDAATKKLESNKDPSKAKSLKEEQNLAKNNYEALNRQLLDELPLFSAKTVEIVQGCVHALIQIKKVFLAKITEEMMKLLDLPSLLGSSPLDSASVVETFHVKYNLIVDQMVSDFDLIPANIFPNAAIGGHPGHFDRRNSSKDGKKIKGVTNNSGHLLKKSNSAGQSETDRVYLEENYKENLYRVTKDYETTELAGISVRRDETVGVIKYKDPTGNCHRWFVDNGSEKGFLPENILSPLKGTKGPGSLFDQPPSSGLIYPPLTPVQRTNSSCSSSSSTSRPIARPAPKAPGKPALVQRAESFSVKAPAPPPPLPPRSSSIDMGPRYDYVSDEGIAISYQNLLLNQEPTARKDRYSNIDEFDPLAPLKDDKFVEHRYEDIDPPDRYENLDPVDLRSSGRQPINETYKAAYPFSPQGPHQVSLKKGTTVLVKHKSDLNGNTEWWYIQNHQGAEGYVPANYLTQP